MSRSNLFRDESQDRRPYNTPSIRRPDGPIRWLLYVTPRHRQRAVRRARVTLLAKRFVRQLGPISRAS